MEKNLNPAAERLLVWSDEFDGAAGAPPNADMWQPKVGGQGWGNGELQFYTNESENACFDGQGNLAITVQRADPRLQHERYQDCEYTSARLITKDHVAIRYGLIQARIKLPAGKGIWPAFWMLGQNIDEVGWPRCGEIDIMENFGKDPVRVQGTVHGPGYSGESGIACCYRAERKLAEDFHVYSVDWELDRIRWYFDDILYAAATARDLHGYPWVFDHDFYLLINVAVGGRFSVEPDSSVKFPQTMLIDYIRIYR